MRDRLESLSVVMAERSVARADVVILDVDMPGLAGPAAVRAASEVAGDLPPIVLCSGLDEDTLHRQALQMGASGVLRKPVTRHELVAAVEHALQASPTPRAAQH